MLKITHNQELNSVGEVAMDAIKFFAKKLRIMKYDAEIRVNFKHGFTDLFKIYASCDYPETGKIVIDIDNAIAEDDVTSDICNRF